VNTATAETMLRFVAVAIFGAILTGFVLLMWRDRR
jgi:hypothetical protein